MSGPTHVLVFACPCGEEVRVPVTQDGPTHTGVNFSVAPGAVPQEHRGHEIGRPLRVEPFGWLEERLAAALGEGWAPEAFLDALADQGLKVVPR